MMDFVNGLSFWDSQIFLMVFRRQGVNTPFFYVAFGENKKVRIYMNVPDKTDLLLHEVAAKIFKSKSLMPETVPWLTLDESINLYLSPHIKIETFPDFREKILSNQELDRGNLDLKSYLKEMFVTFSAGYDEELALRYFAYNRKSIFVRTDLLRDYNEMRPHKDVKFEKLLFRFLENFCNYRTSDTNNHICLAPGIWVFSNSNSFEQFSKNNLEIYVSVNPEFVLDLSSTRPDIQNKIRLNLEMGLLEDF